jgi:hypothetical protein
LAGNLHDNKRTTIWNTMMFARFKKYALDLQALLPSWTAVLDPGSPFPLANAVDFC